MTFTWRETNLRQCIRKKRRTQTTKINCEISNDLRQIRSQKKTFVSTLSMYGYRISSNETQYRTKLLCVGLVKDDEYLNNELLRTLNENEANEMLCNSTEKKLQSKKAKRSQACIKHNKRKCKRKIDTESQTYSQSLQINWVDWLCNSFTPQQHIK
jgi:hypothetical protein